jgi:hypothetical protein
MFHARHPAFKKAPAAGTILRFHRSPTLLALRRQTTESGDTQRQNGDRRFKQGISAAGTAPTGSSVKTLLLLSFEPSPEEKLNMVNAETQVRVPLLRQILVDVRKDFAVSSNWMLRLVCTFVDALGSKHADETETLLREPVWQMSDAERRNICFLGQCHIRRRWRRGKLRRQVRLGLISGIVRSLRRKGCRLSHHFLPMVRLKIGRKNYPKMGQPQKQ